MNKQDKIPKDPQVDRSFDALIRCETDEEVQQIAEYISFANRKCRIVTQWLYNLMKGNHHLHKIGDTDSPDCPIQVRKLLANYIESYIKHGRDVTYKGKYNKSVDAQGLKDIYNALCLDRQWQKKEQKTKHQTRAVTGAYNLANQINGFSLARYCEEFSTSSTDENIFLITGFGHTLSYFSNLENWKKSVQKWKEKRRKFKKDHPDYFAWQDWILLIESECQKQFSNSRFMLTESWFGNEKVSDIVRKHGGGEFDSALLKTHREFCKKYMNAPRKPRWNPICGPVSLKKTQYILSQSSQCHKGGPVRSSITFRDNYLRTGPLDIWIQPFDAKDEICGISLYCVDLNQRTVKCHVRVKTKSPVIVKKDQLTFHDTAYIDLGWGGRETVIFIKGNIYYLKLFANDSKSRNILHQYNELRREKKQIPMQLRTKRANCLDNEIKEGVDSLCKLLSSKNVKRVVIEKGSTRSRKFVAPKRGRRQERRTNYLASAISLNRFIDTLQQTAKRHGMSVVRFGFQPNKKKEQYYAPSQSCPICKERGKRFFINWKNGQAVSKMHGCGDYLCCPNGHVCHSDVAAVKNMASVTHKDRKKRMKVFAKGYTLSEINKKKCQDAFDKYLQTRYNIKMTVESAAVVDQSQGILTSPLAGETQQASLLV